MSNIKKRDFFNAVTGEDNDGENYGKDAAIFRKVDNVDMIFDSRGNYLGIRTCRGKIVDGKYMVKQGPSDFKSFADLMMWDGEKCGNDNFLETKDGNFLQIDAEKTRKIR